MCMCVHVCVCVCVFVCGVCVCVCVCVCVPSRIIWRYLMSFHSQLFIMGSTCAGVVGQQGLLPTHDDPKLWLVELKAGMEREAVICLMQKAVAFAEKGTPLLIKSAFVQDHLKVRAEAPRVTA
jgi:hypothetical protein